MSFIVTAQMLHGAIPVHRALIGMSGAAACADEARVQSGFEEHLVEFYNHDVKLAGSLLLPKSEKTGSSRSLCSWCWPTDWEQYRRQGDIS